MIRTERGRMFSCALLLMLQVALVHALSNQRTRPSTPTPPGGVVSRRHFTAGFLAAMGGLPSSVQAVETIGKDENCNDATCLGVWDGLLADCPHTSRQFGGAACVSSQDDTPGVFAEPWDYAESTSLDWEVQMGQLQAALTKVSERRGDEVRFLLKEGRYMRVVFTDAKSSERSVGEFYFTPNDTTVQYRCLRCRGAYRNG